MTTRLAAFLLLISHLLTEILLLRARPSVFVGLSSANPAADCAARHVANNPVGPGLAGAATAVVMDPAIEIALAATAIPVAAAAIVRFLRMVTSFFAGLIGTAILKALATSRYNNASLRDYLRLCAGDEHGPPESRPA
jgi:hypothetical protein